MPAEGLHVETDVWMSHLTTHRQREDQAPAQTSSRHFDQTAMPLFVLTQMTEGKSLLRKQIRQSSVSGHTHSCS